MDKSKVIVFICMISLITLFFSNLIIAADNSSLSAEEQKIEKAYNCLTGKVAGKCSTLPLEEREFSLLALAYNNTIQRECKSAILNATSSNKTCWPSPSSSCKLKETALAIIALDNIAEDTDNAENWLLSQNTTSQDLEWYLQIDANDATACTISYSGSSYSVAIGADKKLNSDAGPCLTKTASNYWLRISSSCYSKNFTISCDKDFVTNLLYSKSGSSTIYVSSKTNFASASGATTEKIETICLKQGSACNYEGTLWAALALSKTGHDVSNLVPYLIAMSEDNLKYFPESFIYSITKDDEFFQKITSSQLPQKYWSIPSSPYNKYYDSALALISLKDSGSQTIDGAKNYLLNNQGNDGCWGATRDTAFVLYAAWTREPSFTGTGGGGGGDITPSNILDCEDENYFCISSYDCASVQGDVKPSNYKCYGSLSQVCCSKNIVQETCTQKGGTVCPSGKGCSDTEVSSFDSPLCCLANCIERTVAENECEQTNSEYTCRYSCSSDSEEEKTYSCPSSQVCCAPKAAETSYLWLIIILLIVLIILVVLAIIYRNQLKMWLFKKKGKFKQGPSPGETRPPFPPFGGAGAGPLMRRPMPMQPGRRPPMAARRPMPSQRAPASKTDKELEDTLKKLKEMSK